MMAISMSTRRLTVFAITAAITLTCASTAVAFRMIQNTSTGRLTAGSLVACDASGGFLHWTTSTTYWYLNTANQGSGKASAIQASLATWTNVPDADYNLYYGGTTTDGWSTDGRNTMLWATGNGCTGSCLALTALVVQSGQVIVESDVTFNNSVTWTTSGAQYDTQTVATHELGHALGIHHTEVGSTPRPTMYATYFGSGGRSLETDDKEALQCAWCRYGVSVPTPSLLDVISERCRGLVTLEWTAVSGATYYVVQRSSTSTFSNPVTIHSGPGTFLFHDGGTGTRWYRVKACNASSCGCYRNGNRSAPYYSGCY